VATSFSQHENKDEYVYAFKLEAAGMFDGRSDHHGVYTMGLSDKGKALRNLLPARGTPVDVPARGPGVPGSAARR
jgi:hypothetical protein